MLDRQKIIEEVAIALDSLTQPSSITLNELAEVAAKALSRALPEPLPTKTETKDDLLNHMCDSTIKAVRAALYYKELKSWGDDE